MPAIPFLLARSAPSPQAARARHKYAVQQRLSPFRLLAVPGRAAAVITAAVLLAACSASAERPAGGSMPVLSLSSTAASGPAASGPAASAPAASAGSPVTAAPAPVTAPITVSGELAESVGSAAEDLSGPPFTPAEPDAIPLPVPPAASWPPADQVPVARSWSAQMTVVSGGAVSPNGLVGLTVQDGQVCLVPTGAGPTRCVLDLAGAAAPTWWSFAPDGRFAVVVLGPAQSSTLSVLDTVDGSVRTVLPPEGADAGWRLSSATWDGDDALLVIPEVTGPTGEVLRVDRASGAVTPMLTGLAADITAGAPEMWSTADDLFLSPTAGPQVGHVWAVDRASGQARDIGMTAGPGEGLALQGADPNGVSVMACPTGPTGVQGPLLVTQLATGQAAPITAAMIDRCSAVAFSAAGDYGAIAADAADGYQLQITHLRTGTPVLVQDLPVTPPTLAPLMTWRGDTLVITDISGTWALPTVVVTLSW